MYNWFVKYIKVDLIEFVSAWFIYRVEVKAYDNHVWWIGQAGKWPDKRIDDSLPFNSFFLLITKETLLSIFM